MKTTTKLFHIVVWSVLAMAGLGLQAGKEPLYEGLGSYSRKITTDSPESRRSFTQAMAFLHGFNQIAASCSFNCASALDP